MSTERDKIGCDSIATGKSTRGQNRLQKPKIMNGKPRTAYIVRPFIAKDFMVSRCPLNVDDIVKSVNACLVELGGIDELDIINIAAACVNERLGVRYDDALVEYMDVYRDIQVKSDEMTGTNKEEYSVFKCYNASEVCPRAEGSNATVCVADGLDLSIQEDRESFVFGIVRSLIIWITRKINLNTHAEHYLLLPVCATRQETAVEYDKVLKDADALVKRLSRIHSNGLTKRSVSVTKCGCA